MIRVLAQGPCVQYQRDGGWRVGHVMVAALHWPISSWALVRESQTGELLEIHESALQIHPQSPVPEPGADAVQNGEVWHAADDYPDSTRNVMGDFGGIEVKTWCEYSHHETYRYWRGYGVFAEIEPLRWRELREGER